MPNIIHSFDASHAAAGGELLRKDDIELFAARGGFASQAANVDKVQEAVKMGFRKLYVNRDVLLKFHEGCLTTLENHDPSLITVRRDLGIVILAEEKTISIPALPKLGSFDVNLT